VLVVESASALDAFHLFAASEVDNTLANVMARMTELDQTYHKLFPVLQVQVPISQRIFRLYSDREDRTVDRSAGLAHSVLDSFPYWRWEQDQGLYFH
jgi:hypothetical protein